MRNIKISKIIFVLLVALVISPFTVNYVSAEGEGVYSQGSDFKDEFEISKSGVLKSYKGTSETVFIPEAVTAIDDFVFSDHTEIKNVIFPKNLKTIGNYAFQNVALWRMWY